MTTTAVDEAVAGRVAPPVPPGGLPRLLPVTGRPEQLHAHLARYGRPPYRGGPGLLIETVEAAGLTGRGGAAFPVHRKLAIVAGARGRAVIVANGAESEPASHKDAVLLRAAPHLVLDGLQLAAEAIGAREAHLYLHPGAGQEILRVLAERAAAGIDRLAVTVTEAPPRFLAGQESALVNRLGGGPARPTFVPPRVSERGLGGAPTLVQNVETLAHFGLIARYGPRWFRALGTGQEPGSMLTTVHQADGAWLVIEAEIGAPLRALLPAQVQPHTQPQPQPQARPRTQPHTQPQPQAQPRTQSHTAQAQLQAETEARAWTQARALSQNAQAILIGGFHGTWLPAAQAMALTLDNQTLNSAGAALGAGVIAALPADRCGLAEAARVTRYLAAESAGQCGPCLNGLPAIAAALAELAGPRPRRSTRENAERWVGLVTGRGACNHPDGTVRFVRSALTVFADELSRHERGQCSATNRRPFLPLPDRMPTTEDDWTRSTEDDWTRSTEDDWTR
jgi:NADH:ubiquinone oxidoreductase subunit F (NADH-binding)